MKLAWSPEAIEALTAIRTFIAEDDLGAAQRVVIAIWAA